MSDDRPKILTMSHTAFVRGRVIALIGVHLALEREISDAVRLVAATPIPTLSDGSFQRFSERTVWRYWKTYKDGGCQLEALEPKKRQKTKGVFSDELVDFFVAEKLDDPKASVPELIERAKLLGKLHHKAKIHRGTVWRALQRRGVVTGRGRKAAVRDSRRWAYSHRMQMVLADFKRFRAGPTGCKRLALYFIDDATRRILGVGVSTKGEAAREVLRLFHDIVVRHGRMGALYLDQGPGFIADVLDQVANNFDPPIAVIFGETAYPEAHGKIERFNRSVKARVLRHLRKEGIDPDPDALTLRLQHDVETYNAKYHEGIKAKPIDKWHGDSRKKQPVGDENELRHIFTVALDKPSKVSADHVISVGGVHYEVPRGYARQWIQVYRRVLEVTDTTDALYIDHESALLRLQPVDVHFNAHDKRNVSTNSDQPSESVPRGKSAAEFAFERDLEPMVTADGGYHDEEE